jgi:hypothetical protein
LVAHSPKLRFQHCLVPLQGIHMIVDEMHPKTNDGTHDIKGQ